MRIADETAAASVPAGSAAEAFVQALAEGWRAPIDADRFADHFERWLDPDVRLVGPQVPTVVGRRAFRERFARPLFELVPDLHGTVEGWAGSGDTLYIALRLEGTVGKRPVTLHSCDGVTLRDGRAIERIAHLDPTPLPLPVAFTPRAWPRAAPTTERQKATRVTSFHPDEGGPAARRAHDPTSAHSREQPKPMSRRTAALSSAAFFALAPGIVAGVVPWLLTHWRAQHQYWLPLRIAGAALLAAGAVALADAFVRFVIDGIGTPAPAAPPRHLVVNGPYRYVRNPMYLAVLATITGQATGLGQPALFAYAAAVALAVAAFVLGYEEPSLHERFGAQYDGYRHAVPRWRPRTRPWNPAASAPLIPTTREEGP
jgi:protein-S-isoprenylcysteine O-methyltransferase Ste14